MEQAVVEVLAGSFMLVMYENVPFFIALKCAG